jgi:four helix bundle protein
MNFEHLKKRTKQFALDIIKLAQDIPDTQLGNIVRGQIIRAGTSVGSNYRAVCRARSKAEFISKIGVVIEEADESAYWLEIIEETGLLPHERVASLHQEAEEIVAIMNSSRITANNKK